MTGLVRYILFFVPPWFIGPWALVLATSAGVAWYVNGRSANPRPERSRARWWADVGLGLAPLIFFVLAAQVVGVNRYADRSPAAPALLMTLHACTWLFLGWALVLPWRHPRRPLSTTCAMLVCTVLWLWLGSGAGMAIDGTYP